MQLGARRPKFLFLQHSSLFESFGGVEYYMDDLLVSATEVYGSGQVHTVIPQRCDLIDLPKRPYAFHLVPMNQKGLLSKWNNRYSRSYFKVAKALLESVRPSFLVNCHVSLGPLTYLLHRLSGIPYFTCVYGIDCWGNLWPQDEWCLRHSSRIISISKWTKDILVKRGYPDDQIKIIHPRLGTVFETVVPKMRELETFTMLTISRLDAHEKYKGHDHVLQALNILRPLLKTLGLKYIIQGEGTDRPRLERMATEFQLESFVEFHRAVKDREELSSLYQQGDLFIMPSRFGRWAGRWRGEGFGIVYVEAAVFAIPSIAYDCGGATDIIEHEKTGWLVAPDNIGALAKTIEHCARNPLEVRQVGLRARERVLEVFSRFATSREMMAAFDSF